MTFAMIELFLETRGQHVAFLDKHFTLSLSVSIQVYKWVLVNYWGNVNGEKPAMDWH